MTCNCTFEGQNRPPYTRHQKGCPDYNLEAESLEIVNGLVEAIEQLTDELPSKAFDAYNKGLFFTGQFGKIRK